MRSLRLMTNAMAALLALLAWAPPARCQVEGVLGHIRELEARETGIDAYIYGYPLVTMEFSAGSTSLLPKARALRWGSS